MPNTANYAERWEPELLEIYMQETLISPFITTNVRWLSARTFHFTQMSTTGYKSHSRNGGWNRGEFVQTDVPFTLSHDRDIEFLVDRLDVDETNSTASMENISKVFIRTQAVPEANALFFSRVAKEAEKHDGYHTSTALSEYTAANVFIKLKKALGSGKLRRYKAKGALIVYVRSEIMDLLEQSTELAKKIEMTQIAEGGIGLETRVTKIDGVPIFEVIDDEVFYDSFNFDGEDGGFVPAETTYKASTDASVVSGKTYYTVSDGVYTAVKTPTGNPSTSGYYEVDTEGSKKINILIASPLTTKFVPKINSIYFFQPGAHTQGDGWLYQNRAFSDTFTFPNGKDKKVDSVFVDIDVA